MFSIEPRSLSFDDAIARRPGAGASPQLVSRRSAAPPSLPLATPIVAGPGALSEDWPAVRAYADRLDRQIRLLDADARAQIVYANPATLADVAKDYGEGVPAAVAVLQARSKTRGAAQTDKDLAWSGKWHALLVDWIPWLDSVRSVSPGMSPESAWTAEQNFEARLRVLYAEFASLGGTKVTEELPPSLETPTGDKPPDDSIPWKGILWAVGAVAAAFGLGALAKIVRG